MNPIVEFASVTKCFGHGPTEVRALTEVSLSIAAGEFVALMGPSGCGKSTLLHLAGALESPTAGHVKVDGVDLESLDAKARARLRHTDVGYVFQRLNLLVSLTAIENVMLPLEVGGMRTREARAQAAVALRRVDLPEPWDRYPDDFSGGQQQRIAIARAIVGERRVLLADEPTGALDTVNGDLVIELLAEICREQRTAVVLVTHEPRFASWADRVVFVRDGSIADQTASTPPDGASAPTLAGAPA